MNDERFIPLGHPPEDAVSSERYVEALDELKLFAEQDIATVSNLEQLSLQTVKARKALRDIAVSAGKLDLPPQISIQDPSNPPERAMTRLPGSYNFLTQVGEESIQISVEIIGGEEHLLISRNQHSESDLRETEEREKALHFMKGFLPQISDLILDELISKNIVGDIDEAIEAALLRRMQQRTSEVGDLGQQPELHIEQLSPEDLIQSVFTKLVGRIETGLAVHERVLRIHLPVSKDLQACQKTELSIFDCLDNVIASNLLDHPNEPKPNQQFFDAFQQVVRLVLPQLPEAFAVVR